MTTRYKINCTVARVEERFTHHHLNGVGDKAQFEDRSTGWWAVIGPSVAIYLGDTEPKDIASGDACCLTLEKVR